MRVVGEPNRLSALNGLTKCSGLVAMRATEGRSVSGPAADLGTAAGRGQELWHKGYTLAKVLDTLRSEAAVDFPRADMPTCEKIVSFYCADPRNRPHVVVTASLEQEVSLVIPVPGGPDYEAVGHMDQVRYVFPDEKERDNLGYRLWDAKNGKAGGEEMLGDYAFQLAAYTVAAAPLYPGLATGGIIRTKGYIHRGKKEPGTQNVFFHAGWSVDTCRKILAHVAYLIGEIREQRVSHTPGAHCRYCPLDFPNCLTTAPLHLGKVRKRLPCT